jgi:hypothetical protein
MKVNIDYDQANAIAVQCLKDYYKYVTEEERTDNIQIIISLDEVLSCFMTQHEYEDWTNELRYAAHTM